MIRTETGRRWPLPIDESFSYEELYQLTDVLSLDPETRLV
jgi:hypothetical protein